MKRARDTASDDEDDALTRFGPKLPYLAPPLPLPPPQAVLPPLTVLEFAEALLRLPSPHGARGPTEESTRQLALEGAVADLISAMEATTRSPSHITVKRVSSVIEEVIKKHYISRMIEKLSPQVSAAYGATVLPHTLLHTMNAVITHALKWARRGFLGPLCQFYTNQIDLWVSMHLQPALLLLFDGPLFLTRLAQVWHQHLRFNEELRRLMPVLDNQMPHSPLVRPLEGRTITSFGVHRFKQMLDELFPHVQTAIESVYSMVWDDDVVDWSAVKQAVEVLCVAEHTDATQPRLPCRLAVFPTAAASRASRTMPGGDYYIRHVQSPLLAAALKHYTAKWAASSGPFNPATLTMFRTDLATEVGRARRVLPCECTVVGMDHTMRTAFAAAAVPQLDADLKAWCSAVIQSPPCPVASSPVGSLADVFAVLSPSKEAMRQLKHKFADAVKLAGQALVARHHTHHRTEPLERPSPAASSLHQSQQAAAAAQYTKDVVAFHKALEWLVLTVFQSDTQMSGAMAGAMRRILNTDSRFSEVLATAVGAAVSSPLAADADPARRAAGVADLLDLAQFVSLGMDEFLAACESGLKHRLLHGTVVSVQLEREVLARLKTVSLRSFPRLNWLLGDYQTCQTQTREWHSKQTAGDQPGGSAAAAPVPVVMRPIVLHQAPFAHLLPSQATPAIRLPAAMAAWVRLYGTAYASNVANVRRRLRWVFTLGHGTVALARTGSGSEVRVSGTTLQMAVLLLFNDHKQLQVNDVAQSLNLTPKDVVRVLAPMVLSSKSHHQVLAVVPPPPPTTTTSTTDGAVCGATTTNTTSLVRSTTLRVNFEMLRLTKETDVVLRRPPMSEPAAGHSMTGTSLEARPTIIDAGVMRALKRKRVLAHSAVVKCVQADLKQFHPSAREVKESLERMIAHEYVRRQTSAANAPYVYIP